MTPGARLSEAIALLTEIDRAHAAADRISQGWFRTRRYAGSKDRRAVIDLVFDALRSRGMVRWLSEQAGLEPSPRLAVLVASHLELAALDDLLGSSRHAPEPLSEVERAVVTAAMGPHGEAIPAWARFNYPSWLDPLLLRRFGPSRNQELAAFDGRASFDVRVNVLKAKREDVLALLQEGGIVAAPTPIAPNGLRLEGHPRLDGHVAYTSGLIEPQDEASQIAALLVDARPGQQVIDYCAGAGGKTLAIAAAMANRGQIYAHDSDRRRLERLKPRLQRAGVRNVQLIGSDGLIASALQADRVLVDAPCTGTGTWRRNPEARWRLTPDVLARQQERQRALLAEAALRVKPGGRLVYTTCSVLMEENEDRIAEFLALHEDFRVLKLGDIWPLVLSVPCPESEGYLRLTPASHGTDGFFTAILERARD